MDYRDDYERGRRYRDERDVRASDPRDWRRREAERGRWDRPAYDRREYDRRGGDDRGFLERLADELRSWFQDEEERRRMPEEREGRGRWGGATPGWGAGAEEDVDRDWARQWGYVDRGEGGRRRQRWSDAPRSGGASWWGERGRESYGREGYGQERDAGDRYYEPRFGWGDPSAWGAEPGRGERGREGASSAGPHAGRGPRGYQRTDERIREDVCDVLSEHGYIDASEIEVTVSSGEVTLAGTVRERAQKRMAEDAVDQISGVREVHNQLRVSPGGSDQEPYGRPGDPRFRVA